MNNNTFIQYLIEQQLQERRQQPAVSLGSEQQPPKGIKQSYINAAKQIVRDCKPYLVEHEQFDIYPLLRGLKKNQQNIVAKRNIRKNRRARDTPKRLHQLYDAWFKTHFGIAFRNNATFTTGSLNEADEYGLPVVVFPIGRYQYIWSPQVKDLFSDYDKQDVTNKFKESSLLQNKKVSKQQRRSYLEALERYFESNKPSSFDKQVAFNAIDYALSHNDWKTDQITEAIKFGNEIMLTGQRYYSIPFNWNNKIGFSQLVKAVMEGDVEKYI